MNTGTAIVLGVVVLAGAALAAVVLLKQQAPPVAPPPVMTTQPAPGPAQQVGSTLDDVIHIVGGLVDTFGGIFGNP